MLARMFLIAVFILTTGYFTNSSFALELGAQGVNLTVGESFVSRYIWRGQDLYANNDAACQPSIDIASPGLLEGVDLSLNVWGSFPINSGHEDAEELDYTLILSKDVTERLNISVGYTYFDFPNTTSKVDVQEPWVSFTLDKISKFPIDVSMNVFVGYDSQTVSGGPDEGWYYSWGFSTDLPLPEALTSAEGQSLTLDIVNWGNDGVADLKPSLLYATEFSLSSSYVFGGLSITPSFHYTINYGDNINSGDEELWSVLEISYEF